MPEILEQQEEFDVKDFKRELAADIAVFAENMNRQTTEGDEQREKKIVAKIAAAIVDNPTLCDELLKAVEAVISIDQYSGTFSQRDLSPSNRVYLYQDILFGILVELVARLQCQTETFTEAGREEVPSLTPLQEALAGCTLTRLELSVDAFSAETEASLKRIAGLLAGFMCDIGPQESSFFIYQWREMWEDRYEDIADEIRDPDGVLKCRKAHNFVLEQAIDLLADRIARSSAVGEKEDREAGDVARGVQGGVKDALEA